MSALPNGQPSEERAAGGGTGRRRIRRILVVDDEPTLSELIRLCLDDYYYQVDASPSGEEALEQLTSEVNDLVLLDIQLPGMNGYELAQAIRAQWSPEALPVVAVTASVMPAEREKCLSSGCNGFIAKPIDILSFSDQITRFLSPAG